MDMMLSSEDRGEADDRMDGMARAVDEAVACAGDVYVVGFEPV